MERSGLREPVRLIALDLDGTLLNSDKELTAGNAGALRRAAEAGIEIVPVTGRLPDALPEAVKRLPFLHYVIAVNGALTCDLRSGAALRREEIPWRRAIELMEYLDTLPCIYDCYMEGAAWMTAAQKARIGEFAPDIHYKKMLEELRRPVPELKAFLAERKTDIQKSQLFVRDMELHRRLLAAELPERFPDLIFTSSVRNNIEANAPRANKGEALNALADALAIPRGATMAFGDGLNDLSMLRAAGVGVAMANACPEAFAAADAVTLDCDHDGVAAAILACCFPHSELTPRSGRQIEKDGKKA